MQEPTYSTPLPSPTEYAAPAAGMRVVRSIGIGSAFKIGAVLSALLFAVIGFFIILLPSLFGASLLGMFSNRGGMNPAMSGGAVGATGIVFYFFGIVLYGVFGGIFGAIYAALYNLVANWVGGIELELK
jgi:hypothetical protein